MPAVPDIENGEVEPGFHEIEGRNTIGQPNPSMLARQFPINTKYGQQTWEMGARWMSQGNKLRLDTVRGRTLVFLQRRTDPTI